MLILILCSLALFFVSELQNAGSSLPVTPVWWEDPLIALEVTAYSRDSPVIPSRAHGVSWWSKASRAREDRRLPAMPPPSLPNSYSSYLGTTSNIYSLLQLTE